jgi:hypothetical protein
MQINPIAVGVATLAAYALAGLWYSPLLFFKAWQTEFGFSDELARRATRPASLITAFLIVLAGATTFAFFLGKVSPAMGALYGFCAGFVWVAGSIGINYMFESRSWKLFAINGGYHTLEFTIIGLVLGLIH